MKKHFFLFLALLCLPLGGVGGGRLGQKTLTLTMTVSYVQL